MKTNEAKKVSKVMAEMAAQSVNPVMVAVAPIVNKPTEEAPKAEEMASESTDTKSPLLNDPFAITLCYRARELPIFGNPLFHI